MKDFGLTHINTGCYYCSNGQEITIVTDGKDTHFIDHSRMVYGTIEGTRTVREVIKAYLSGHYTYLKLDTSARINIENAYFSFDFVDFSHEYRNGYFGE